MNVFFGDDYVTAISNLEFTPSGGQFSPQAMGFAYSEFFGVGEDDLIGDTFRIGGPVSVDLPFRGETEIFRAEIFGEIGAQFGLRIDAGLDPGSVDAILPYRTIVAFPDFDAAAIADGDIVDIFFGAQLDPGANPDTGFTTQFPSFTFSIGIVTELLVELAATVGAFGENETFRILDFAVPETYLPIFSLDTARDITALDVDDNPDLVVGDFNPIELFGITTPVLIDEVDGIDPAYNDAGEVAGIGIPLSSFVSSPSSSKAETTDASADGEGAEQDPGFDLSAIDLGRIEIFVPNINTVSKSADGIFVTDPTREAKYVYDDDGKLLRIDRVEDLDDAGENLGEGNRDDLAALTLDLDGLVTYASGGTFPPLEFGPIGLGAGTIGGGIGQIDLDASFSYNLLDVELEAALPLEQEFTLTPKLVTQLKFWETDGSGAKIDIAKDVELLMQQKVLRFDETGIFQDAAVEARLRELAEGNALYAQDIDAFLDLDAGIAGAFTGQTASVGGRMIVSRDGGVTWQELFTNASDPIAESAPTLGQDQTVDLTLAEGTRLGYRLFIGSGSSEIQEDYEIDFDATDSVYVEEIADTSQLIDQTPFLDDLTVLNLVYDDAETFVEVVSKATPIVTNRTGLEFDLALLVSGLAASASFNATATLGPLSFGTGLDFALGPLFEEKFELLNLDIVDLFNGTFQLEDSKTTNFVLGGTAPASDFGDAIVLTSGNDVFTGSAADDEIVALGGEDSIDAGDGDDTIILGALSDIVYGGDGFDTVDLSDLQGAIRGSDLVTLGKVLETAGNRGGISLDGTGKFAALADVVARSADPNGRHQLNDVERIVMTEFADIVVGVDQHDVDVYEAGDGNDYVLPLFNSPNDATFLGQGGDDLFQLERPDFYGILDGGEGFDTLLIDRDVDLQDEDGPDGSTLRDFEGLIAASNVAVTFRGTNGANKLEGERLDDILEGRGGNDELIGRDGDDLLIGGPGADAIYGGAGIDTADYSNAPTSVFIDLDFAGTGRGFRGEAQGDFLDGVENVTGSAFEDILIGDDAANTLMGGLGDDRLQAQNGGDALYGGEGSDLLSRVEVATRGGAFGTTYFGGDDADGGDLDIVAVDVFDSFRQTGKYTADNGGRFTFREGLLAGTEKVAFRDIEIDYRYERSAHVELDLDETGSGTIRYVEDDAIDRFLATRIEGTAVYGSRSSFIDPNWDKRTSSYDINISDQALIDLRGDTIDYPTGDFFSTFGTGTVDSTAGAPNVRGGVFGTEGVVGIEGLIGSKGDDVIAGNARDNALYGNGGYDALGGGSGDDRLGFGTAQPVADNFTFPGSGGGGGGGPGGPLAPDTRGLTLAERLARLDPDDASSAISFGGGFLVGDSGAAPVGQINVGFTSNPDFVTIGSFLWGGAGTDTLDMRFDRGLGFFPDSSTNFAVVDLGGGNSALINEYTGLATQWGEATWRESDGSQLNEAITFGVENIIGSRRDDTLSGDRKDNRIEGLDGADVMDGSDGIDTASYALAGEGVTLNFLALNGGVVMDNARATITGRGDATGDFAENFEIYVGSAHDDVAILNIAPTARTVTRTAQITYPINVQTGTKGTPPAPVFEEDEQTSETTFLVHAIATAAPGITLDLGAGDDHADLSGGGGRQTVALGDGDDTATLRNGGHTIDAGAGDDVITIIEPDQRIYLSSEAQTTRIDGGADEDTVVFTGSRFQRLSITDDGVIVTQGVEAIIPPQSTVFTYEDPLLGQREFDFATDDQVVLERAEARESGGPIYHLTNVEFVEINGERVRITNPDPVVDADTVLTVAEDGIDPYDLGLNIARSEIDAGATFEILALPQTAALVTPAGTPLVVGATVSAADMAALQVLPGQGFDPSIDAIRYLRVGDPVEDTRTATLPETVRGAALNITAHVTTVEIDATPPPPPPPEIALVRLNPALDIGSGPAASDLDHGIAAGFDDMPSGNMTVEFLFRSAGGYEPEVIQTFLSYAVAGNANELLIEDSRGADGIRILVAGKSVETGWRAEQLFDRELHRVSAVFDSGNDTVEVFVDGISIFDGVVPGLAPIDAGGTLTIGQEQDSVGGGFNPIQTLKGDIGDIRIWDGARSAAEIAATAFAELDDPSGEADLAAYWQADPANQGVMVNAVGDTQFRLINGPDIVSAIDPAPSPATVIPTVRVNTGGAENEYIQSNPAPMPTGDATIEFVMQALDLPDEFNERQHFASYAVPGSNNEFLMFVDGTNGNGTIGMGVSGNGGFDTGLPSSLIMDGQPHRISVTLDTATQIVTLYIDGVAVFTGDGNGPLALQSGGSFNFGQEQDSVGGSFSAAQEVRADFGDIRLWDTVRTPAEIAATAFVEIADPAAEPNLVANWQVDPADTANVPDVLGGQAMARVGAPATGSVQFPLPDVSGPMPPDPEPATITQVVDAQGDPVTITVDEVPANGAVFYMAPDPALLAAGISVPVETPVAPGDTLTPDQLEGLYFRGDPNFSGDAGTFRYTVRDDVAFRQLSATAGPDTNDAAGGALNDGAAGQTIAFDVVAVNDAPTVRTLLFPLSPGGKVESTVRGADAEGDDFELSLLEQGRFGTVTMTPDGSFIYRQDSEIDFAGAAFVEDRFRVQATETPPGDGFAARALALGSTSPPAPAVSNREQIVRIVNPDFQSEIVFDPDDPEYFDDDGNPIKLGGLGTDDVIRGHSGPDGLFGFGGADKLFGARGDDSLSGGAGDDTVLPGLGDDTADGGEGSGDTVSYEDVPVALGALGVVVDLTKQGSPQNTAGAGDDHLSNFENARGTAGVDNLIGDGGANSLWGGNSGDIVTGGAGADVLYGGNGIDGKGSPDFLEGGPGADAIYGGENGTDDGSFDFAAYFSTAPAGGGELVIDVRTPFGDPANTSSDEVREDLIGDDIEGFAGSNVVDTRFIATGIAEPTLYLGGTRSDLVFGGEGQDQIFANFGDDVLEGNGGTDLLAGSFGDDLLRPGSDGVLDVMLFGDREGLDTIEGFEVGVDRLLFNGVEVDRLVDLAFEVLDIDGQGLLDTRITRADGAADFRIDVLGVDESGNLAAGADIQFA